MISSNVLYRVLCFRYGNSMGTCFTIDIDNKQYVVTAKHIVNGLAGNGIIELLHDNTWKACNCKLIGHSVDADVSVLAFIDTTIEGQYLEATARNMAYGQDLYFLGFPYGFKFDVDQATNRGFPFPLVKKGIASTLSTTAQPQHFLIDGHNNSGFSGGPVVFRPFGTGDFQVGGIISGYYPEQDNNGLPIANTNSGIIMVYDINNAIELIRANPNGTDIPVVV
jgi:hypothetical protein